MPTNAPPSPRWPRIVAESLRDLETLPMQRRRAASGHRLAWEAIRDPFLPSLATGNPPPFLRAHQEVPWRRIVAALDRYGGALLAEPVGSGKTWIALGVASRTGIAPVVIAPAIVLDQWRQAADLAGVGLHLWSHERMSRGRVPPHESALVVIDEAHRFRTPATRRVRTLTPWLSGRRVLLLTATPIVNRLDDLVHLLRLALPEDALRLDGIPHLADLLACARPPISIGRIAVRTRSQDAGTPGVRRRRLVASPGEVGQADALLRGLATLRLSRLPAVRRLVRGVLLDAAASSGAAWLAALRRYRALLLQAQDAGGASRALVRQFAGAALEQTVLWSLVPHDDEAADLCVDDLARLGPLLQAQVGDAWVDRLSGLLDPGEITVCFARHVATAELLRERLGDRVAWVIGSRAGIGPHRLPRPVVLAAFGPGRGEWRARRTPPDVLVSSDVAAEGLDLQAAGRVVHLDLPWTAVRLAQREGRLVRIGQCRDEVEVVIREPAPALTAALALTTIVHRKAALADRWLAGIEATDLRQSPVAPSRRERGDCDGTLVTVAVHGGNRSGAMALQRESDGTWRMLGTLAELEDAVGAVCRWPPCAEDGEMMIDAARAARRLAVGLPLPQSSELLARIHRMAQEAARRRDARALRQLDRLLRFVVAPGTAGDRARVERLAAASDRELLYVTVPDRPVPAPITVEPLLAVHFRSARGPLRCPDA